MSLLSLSLLGVSRLESRPESRPPSRPPFVRYAWVSFFSALVSPASIDVTYVAAELPFCIVCVLTH
jgi:hypothetical protein